MDSRLDRLEERIAYQDKLLCDLDEVVRELATRLVTTERRLKELLESAGPADLGPQDDPPPHY